MKRLRVVLGAAALCGGLLIGDFARGLDLDGDGVSDVYLDHFGIAPIGIETDLDDDGYTTGAESQFGTDPTAPASRPGLALTRTETALTLQWPTVNGIVYQLQASDDLTTWTDDGTFVLGDGSPATTTRSPEVARRFYRLGASHGPDEDGDGLTRDPESLTRKTRLAYLGVWPNYPYNPPPLPEIRLSFIDQDTGLEVAYIDQNGAFTANATPLGLYFGYSSRAQPDPVLEPGKDYTMQLTFAGNALWGNVYGRFFATNLNPEGPPLHAILYSTRFNGGSYYYSNPTGGVWHESVWQATGAPSNNVANAINFPVVATPETVAASLPADAPPAAAPPHTATVNLPEVDLDVDSDNNDGTGAPSRKKAEDALEDTQAKMVQVNDDSDNDDAIPDHTQPQVDNEDDLVPLILQVGTKRIDWTKVSLKFSFPQSEVRLWRIAKQSDTKEASLEIQPDTEYTAAALNLSRNARQLKLFMEGTAVAVLFQGKSILAVRNLSTGLRTVTVTPETYAGPKPSMGCATVFAWSLLAGIGLIFAALHGGPLLSGLSDAPALQDGTHTFLLVCNPITALGFGSAFNFVFHRWAMGRYQARHDQARTFLEHWLSQLDQTLPPENAAAAPPPV